MVVLVLAAYVELMRIDFRLTRNDFAGIYARVRRTSVGTSPGGPGTVDAICGVIDTAAVWYWKQVSCLHRSAATTCLLRRAGIDARLVIGAQALPFRAHAWVEIEGIVVNDKPYVPEIYAILDRC
ncbi:MAG: lasso peptide biosynthesis B2 protein [Acidobacteriota bacterium]